MSRRCHHDYPTGTSPLEHDISQRWYQLCHPKKLMVTDKRSLGLGGGIPDHKGDCGCGSVFVYRLI